jgi:hypothetical protein
MGGIRAVAIAESMNPKTGVSGMIQCLGTFRTLTEAYGEAMVYLTELAEGSYEYNNDDEECTISPLRGLEGETGYGIYLRNKAGETLDVVFILHAGEPETETAERGDADGSS